MVGKRSHKVKSGKVRARSTSLVGDYLSGLENWLGEPLGGLTFYSPNCTGCGPKKEGVG